MHDIERVKERERDADRAWYYYNLATPQMLQFWACNFPHVIRLQQISTRRCTNNDSTHRSTALYMYIYRTRSAIAGRLKLTRDKNAADHENVLWQVWHNYGHSRTYTMGIHTPISPIWTSQPRERNEIWNWKKCRSYHSSNPPQLSQKFPTSLLTAAGIDKTRSNTLVPSTQNTA